MKHRFISKGNTTGATNDIRNYESTDETNKNVNNDVIDDDTTDLAYDIHLYFPTYRNVVPTLTIVYCMHYVTMESTFATR